MARMIISNEKKNPITLRYRGAPEKGEKRGPVRSLDLGSALDRRRVAQDTAPTRETIGSPERIVDAREYAAMNQDPRVRALFIDGTLRSWPADMPSPTA